MITTPHHLFSYSLPPQQHKLHSLASSGITRACFRSYGFEWAPLLDCNTLKKNQNEHHWVVGVTDDSLMCVICKGNVR